MDCREARENYSDYIEDATESVKAAMGEHIAQCPHCRSEVEKLGKVVVMLANMAEIETPPGFSVRLNERLDELERGSVIRRIWLGLTNTSGWAKPVAMAATVIMVFLGTFYLTGRLPDVNSPTADTVAGEKISPTYEGTMVASEDTGFRSPEKEKPKIKIVAAEVRQPGTGSGRRAKVIQPVSYHDPVPDFARESISPPSATLRTRRANPLKPSVSATQPESPASERSTAIYPDYIVIIQSENHADTAEQVVSHAKASEGEILVYSDEAKFVLIPIELADYYLLSMKSLGDVIVMKGPIERSSAKNFLIEVVIIPPVP